MYTVLIVDDERMIIESIKGKIKWDELHLKFIGQACNGVEALEQIKTLLPDIAIIDIKMPLKDGVEVMDELTSSKIHTKVIISSAYTDFEYAKKALLNQAVDYLVKPIIVEELNNAIKKSITQIELKRTEREELFSELLISTQNKAHSILNRLSGADRKAYDKSCGMIVVISYTGSTVLREIKSWFKEDHVSMAIHRMEIFTNTNKENELVIIVGFEDDAHAVKNFSLLKELAEKILINYPTEKSNIYIGMGHILKDLYEIPASYHNISLAIENRCINTSGIIEFDKNVLNADWNIKPVSSETRRKLVLYLERGDRNGILKIINEIFDIIGQEKNIRIKMLLNTLIDITNTIESCSSEGKEATPQDSYCTFYTMLNSSSSIDDLPVFKKRFIEFIEKQIDKTVSSRLFSSRKAVYEIKKYIDENYSENIKLKDIVQNYYMREEYFSKLFKDEFGESFVEYLTRVRLQKAVELIKQENIKLNEVSELTGYNDAKYFSKLFKKKYGITPSQMKEKNNRKA